MREEFLNIPLNKNTIKKRFEIELNGHFAFINYGEMGNKIVLVHTESEPELAGTGAASAVVEKTLNYIESNHYTLLPFCPFVFAYIQKHPEWKRIVDKKFHAYDEL